LARLEAESRRLPPAELARRVAELEEKQRQERQAELETERLEMERAEQQAEHAARLRQLETVAINGDTCQRRARPRVRLGAQRVRSLRQPFKHVQAVRTGCACDTSTLIVFDFDGRRSNWRTCRTVEDVSCNFATARNA
jgi:hypothetical protein